MAKTLVNYPYLTEPVEIYKLENGHTIVLAHKEGELVNVSSWVKTGSINENDKNNGISHVLEHLMFKGTSRFKVGEFDRILESKGGIVNAATWKDYTFYYITLPKGKNDENLYLAIDLHSDMMTGIVLPEEEIGAPFDINDKTVTDKRERHVVIEEIRMRKDQNWTKVYNNCNRNMYSNHPYRRDVIGTPEIISKVTRDEIMDYYKTYYTPENITTIVVGDFDKEKVLKAVIDGFKFNGTKNAPKQEYAIDTPVQQTRVIEEKINTDSTYIMFGWLGAKAANLKDNLMLSLTSVILGDGTSSRLYRKLIEKQPEPIVYYVESYDYNFKDGGNFFIQINCRTDKKDEVIEMVKAELAGLLTDKITEKELQKAKKQIKTGFAEHSETVSEIGDTIGYNMTVVGNLDGVANYLKFIDDAGIDDIENVIKKYLNINNAVISILTEKD